MKLVRASLLVAVVPLVAACWAGETLDHTGNHVSSRRGAVVVEGCSLDDSQTATLAAASTKKILSEVVLLCASIRADASMSPAAPADRTALAAQVSNIEALGYRVSIASTMGPTWDAPLSPADASSLLQSMNVAVVANAELALVQQVGADGFDFALPTIFSDATTRTDLENLVRRTSSVLRPSLRLGVFTPPSSQSPSDIQGGDAYALAALASYVDEFRLMTLDFSCCGAPLGPTTDPGWAVDVERFNEPASKPAAISVAYPLYGWDTVVGSSAAPKPVTWASATALAATTRANLSRGPTGAPYFDYVASDGSRHEVWFDDATSTLHALHAWDGALASGTSGVGVVYYGLGAEDPQLWNAIAKERP